MPFLTPNLFFWKWMLGDSYLIAIERLAVLEKLSRFVVNRIVADDKGWRGDGRSWRVEGSKDREIGRAGLSCLSRYRRGIRKMRSREPFFSHLSQYVSSSNCFEPPFTLSSSPAVFSHYITFYLVSASYAFPTYVVDTAILWATIQIRLRSVTFVKAFLHTSRSFRNYFTFSLNKRVLLSLELYDLTKICFLSKRINRIKQNVQIILCPMFLLLLRNKSHSLFTESLNNNLDRRNNWFDSFFDTKSICFFCSMLYVMQ